MMSENQSGNDVVNFKIGNWLLFIATLFGVCLFSTQLLSYKIVSVGHYVMSAATFVVPIWYLLGDTITEVYGYKITKRLIWSAIISALFFALLVDVLIKLPSPPTWHHQEQYDYVLGGITRIAIANAFGSLVGGLINSKVLARWKILVRGKYFVLRSLACSIVGQIIFIIIAISITFIGHEPLYEVFEIMVASLITKVIILLLFVYPVSLIVVLLKKAEGIDPFFQNDQIDPFKRNLES